jgi:hypothetical protein
MRGRDWLVVVIGVGIVAFLIALGVAVLVGHKVEPDPPGDDHDWGLALHLDLRAPTPGPELASS